MPDNTEFLEHSHRAEESDEALRFEASTQIASDQTLETHDVVGERTQTLFESIQQGDEEKNVPKSQPQKTSPSTQDKRVTALQSDIFRKDVEIRELKEEVAECKEKIQTLEKQVATLRETNGKQMATIKNQSEIIQKNPAPHKNRERYLASLFQQGFRASGGASTSNDSPSVAPRQQSAVAGSGREGPGRASISVDPTVQPTRYTASATATTLPSSHIQRSSNIRVPPLRPPQAFSCGNIPLQQDSPLENLQGGGFAIPRTLPANVVSELVAGQLHSNASLPASTIGGRPEIMPPPGIGSRPQYTEQIPYSIDNSGSQLGGLTASNEASLRQLRDMLDGLFGKVDRWTRDYTTGDMLISISPKILETIRSIGLSDQLGLNLLSRHETKGLVTARVINAFIKARILTPEFLLSIDSNFKDQVERTYARVPSEGPGPAHLHQDVMVSIASLFQALPQRADWSNWLATQVPALTSELYYLVEILLNYHSRGPMELEMLGRLTEIVSNAIDTSLLMYSRPFVYRLPFPETGMTFNPAEMKQAEGGTSAEDSPAGMVVVLAVAPLIVAECWYNGQLRPYMIRRGKVSM